MISDAAGVHDLVEGQQAEVDRHHSRFSAECRPDPCADESRLRRVSGESAPAQTPRTGPCHAEITAVALMSSPITSRARRPSSLCGSTPHGLAVFCDRGHQILPTRRTVRAVDEQHQVSDIFVRDSSANVTASSTPELGLNLLPCRGRGRYATDRSDRVRATGALPPCPVQLRIEHRVARKR